MYFIVFNQTHKTVGFFHLRGNLNSSYFQKITTTTSTSTRTSSANLISFTLYNMNGAAARLNKLMTEENILNFPNLRKIITVILMLCHLCLLYPKLFLRTYSIHNDDFNNKKYSHKISLSLTHSLSFSDSSFNSPLAFLSVRQTRNKLLCYLKMNSQRHVYQLKRH